MNRAANSQNQLSLWHAISRFLHFLRECLFASWSLSICAMAFYLHMIYIKESTLVMQVRSVALEIRPLVIQTWPIKMQIRSITIQRAPNVCFNLSFLYLINMS